MSYNGIINLSIQELQKRLLVTLVCFKIKTWWQHFHLNKASKLAWYRFKSILFTFNTDYDWITGFIYKCLNYDEQEKKNPSIYFSCLVCYSLNILINMYIHMHICYMHIYIYKVFLLIMIKKYACRQLIWNADVPCVIFNVSCWLVLYFLSVRKKTE